MIDWLDKQKNDKQSAFYIPSLTYCMRNSKAIADLANTKRQMNTEFYDGSWAPPSNDTKLPQNTPQGKVITIEQEANQSADEVLRRAFDGLPPSRVIIALKAIGKVILPIAEGKSTELAEVVARIRGREPLIKSSVDAEENKCMEWLCNGSNDLIIHESYLSGFEWPSIVWIGVQNLSQDTIMRAVSTLVIVNHEYDKVCRKSNNQSYRDLDLD